MVSQWRRWIVVGALAGSFLPGAAWASEVDTLLNKLVEKGILTSTEAQEVRNEIGGEAQQRADQQKSFVKDAAKEVVPEWVRNWNWKGDIRLRNEYRNQTGSGNDVNRQRIRFRYGFEAKANDQLTVGARMATGTITDPISTNQNLGTSFTHKTLVLDRAYVNYVPEVPGIGKVKLSGGMVENPFWMVPPGQLVWDDDLNFDGAALHVEQALGPFNLFATGGLFSLDTNIVRSSTLWGLQGGASLQPLKGIGMSEALENLKLTAAMAYYDYVNVTSKTSDTTAITNAGGLKGNSSDLKDLNLLNPMFALETLVAGVPVGLFGDWVHNTASATANNGFLLGVKVGKAKVPFDLKQGWEAGYYFERLDPNATFGAFTNSDFGNGGTNHRGHVWWAKLAVLKNSTVGFTAFSTQELVGSKNHVDTYQMDWVTAF